MSNRKTTPEVGMMDPIEHLEDRLDRVYTELADIERQLILRLPVEHARDEQVWSEFVRLSEEVSALWTGPGAVDEIRAQREK